MIFFNRSTRRKIVWLFIICSSRLIALCQTYGFAFPSANNTFLRAAGEIGSPSGVGIDLYTGTA